MTEAFVQADEAIADVPRLPGWLCVIVNVGAAAAPWAGIFVALR